MDKHFQEIFFLLNNAKSSLIMILTNVSFISKSQMYSDILIAIINLYAASLSKTNKTKNYGKFFFLWYNFFLYSFNSLIILYHHQRRILLDYFLSLFGFLMSWLMVLMLLLLCTCHQFSSFICILYCNIFLIQKKNFNKVIRYINHLSHI